MRISLLSMMCSDVMKGFESTIFAYGQTGTGKTHTMEGDITHDNDNRGIIPRSAQAIFEALQKPQYKEHAVYCSYLELYNEELCDLLDISSNSSSSNQPKSKSFSGNNASKLEIIQGKEGPFCRGLSEVPVYSSSDVLQLMQKAQSNRKVGETKMNKHSSRSHCIFTLKVHAKTMLAEGGNIDFTGKLHMVDLAGSECAKTANLDRCSGSTVGEDAARERERMNINRSLLTLGRVIQMLKDRSKSGSNKIVRIPYRDSKLTRILQESLGGRCKTVIIATLSPSVTAIDESISTLNYAQSARGIDNKPISTSFMALGGMQLCTNSDTDATNGNNNSKSGGLTVEHWQEMECRLEYMKAQVEEAQGALARKHLQQQELMERAEKAEGEKDQIERELLTLNLEKERIESSWKQEQIRRQEVEESLDKHRYYLSRTNALLKATQSTESKLSDEANSLLHVLSSTSEQYDNCYELLHRQHQLDAERKSETVSFHSTLTTALKSDLGACFTNLDAAIQQHRAGMDDATQSLQLEQSKQFQNFQAIWTEMQQKFHSITNEVEEFQKVSAKKYLEQTDVLQSKLQSLQSASNKIHTVNQEFLIDTRKNIQTHTDGSTQLVDEQEDTLQKLHNLLQNQTASSLNNMKEMVKQLNDSMQSAQKIRLDAAQEHTSLLEELQTSLECTKNEQSLEVSNGMEILQNVSAQVVSCPARQSIQSIFQRQHTHYPRAREKQLAYYKKHESSINDHKMRIDEISDQIQKHVKQELENSILEGVQTLIKNQLDEFCQATLKKKLHEISNSTNVLDDENRSQKSNSDNFMDIIQDDSNSLQREFTKVEQNQDLSLKEMASAQVTMNHVLQSVQEANDFTKTKLAGLKNFYREQSNEQDKLSQSVGNTVQVYEKKQTEMLSNVSNATDSKFRSIQEKNIQLLQKNILSYKQNVSNEITIHQQKCDEFSKEMQEHHALIGNMLLPNLRNVYQELSNTCKSSLKDVCDITKERNQLFEKEIIPGTREAYNSIVQNMNTQTHNLQDVVVKNVVKRGQTVSDQCQTCVKDFAHDVIRMNEKESFILPDKFVLEYCKNLSQTPAEVSVLNAVGIPLEYTRCGDEEDEVDTSCCKDQDICDNDERDDSSELSMSVSGDKDSESSSIIDKENITCNDDNIRKTSNSKVQHKDKDASLSQGKRIKKVMQGAPSPSLKKRTVQRNSSSSLHSVSKSNDTISSVSTSDRKAVAVKKRRGIYESSPAGKMRVLGSRNKSSRNGRNNHKRH